MILLAHMLGKIFTCIEIRFNLVFRKTNRKCMDKNVENVLNSEKSLLNLGLVLSKTMKITTQRYYYFVCYLHVYENLSVTLGVEQRQRALRVGC